MVNTNRGIGDVSSKLAEIAKENYMISEMPVFCDNHKLQVNGNQSQLKLLDAKHYALAIRYTAQDFIKVNLDSLEQTKLFTTEYTSPNWWCAKLLPRYESYVYDYVIAFAYNLKQVYRFTTNGVIKTALTGQNLGWLKNTGFDWVPNVDGYAIGTWMYAEYILDSYADYATTPTLKVWRSTDQGANWTEVFSKKAKGGSPDDFEIYHFHVCKHDPYNVGHWYLSSGDDAAESFIWRSTDDGLTWTDISDLTWSGEKQKVHRATDFYFTDDFIYWGLDDYINTEDIGSAWVRTPRNLGEGNRLQITKLANLQNWVRNTIRTPYGILVLTEKRPTDTSNGLVWLIPYEDLEHPILISKTPGASYGDQLTDSSFGSRYFYGYTTRTNKLYDKSLSGESFNILTISKLDRE